MGTMKRYGGVLNDPVVKEEVRKAWFKSKPKPFDAPACGVREHGGSVVPNYPLARCLHPYRVDECAEKDSVRIWPRAEARRRPGGLSHSPAVGIHVVVAYLPYG